MSMNHLYRAPITAFSHDKVPDHLKDAIRIAIKDMHGWCSELKALSLADMILRIHPSIIVEIGVFGGRSLIPQAMALREDAKGGIIYGIDPWRTEDALEGNLSPADKEWWGKLNIEHIHACCMKEIWKHQLEPHSIIIRNASQHVPKLFPGGIDILHIDGTHSEEASTRDVNLYLPQLRFGGYLLFDDSDWPTAQKAVAMVAKECDQIDKVDSCILFRRRIPFATDYTPPQFREYPAQMPAEPFKAKRGPPNGAPQNLWRFQKAG